MNLRKRIFPIALVITATILVFTIVRFGTAGSNNYNSEEIVPLIKYKTQLVFDGNSVFLSENGLFGVLNESDRTLIEPKYNFLEFFENGSLLAQKDMNGSMKYGIINLNDDILTPFIFETFTKQGAYWLGSLNDKSDGFKNCVFFSKNGTKLRAELWDSFEPNSDGSFYLKKNNAETEASYDADSGKILMQKLKVKENFSSKDFTIAVIANDKILTENFDGFSVLAKNSVNVLQDLFADPEDVKTATGFENHEILKNFHALLSTQGYNFEAVTFAQIREISAQIESAHSLYFDCELKLRLSFKTGFENVREVSYKTLKITAKKTAQNSFEIDAIELK